jgi:phospholipid/cholesterol/gamma-HCH transport system ATP-binding protein
MTVYENVATPNSGNDELEQTGNRSQGYGQNRTGRARRSSAEISIANPGGMRKRSALARALITDPQIVLFDEPTTGLDPVRKNAILSMIAQYHKKFGFTAILVSHEISDIFFISNRILALVAAAFMVRLFILFHDCVHGSLLGGRASTHSSDSRSNNNKIISESKIRFRHALYFFKCQ